MGTSELLERAKSERKPEVEVNKSGIRIYNEAKDIISSHTSEYSKCHPPSVGWESRTAWVSVDADQPELEVAVQKSSSERFNYTDRHYSILFRDIELEGTGYPPERQAIFDINGREVYAPDGERVTDLDKLEDIESLLSDVQQALSGEHSV